MIGKKKEKVKSKGKEEKNVEFTFYAPEATEVFLAGEFNSWDTQSVPMKKDKGGVWKAKIKLFPGRYEYKLYADNTWVENLPNAELSSNLFGTQNFVAWVK
jgi:5'-AMP-activated protein kinase regulatory beta subunit